MRNILIICSLLALLLGCAKKNTIEEPTPLERIEAEAKFIKRWQVSVSSKKYKELIRLQPYIEQDSIYAVAPNGHLLALDRVSGKRRWRVAIGETIIAGVSGYSGLVFVGTRNGELLAYKQQDGQEAWRAELSSEMLAVAAAGLGVVVARTVDGNIQAFSSTDGEKLWSYKYSVPTLTLRGTASPVLFAGAVLVGTDNGRLAVLSIADGRLLWEAPVAVPVGASELARMVDVDAPIIVDKGVIYVAAYQGRVAALSMSSGQVIWARDRSVFLSMSIDSENLYLVDADSRVWALDRLTGSTVWVQEKLRARPVSGVMAANGRVLIGDYQGYLHALDTADGRFIARTRLGKKPIVATPQVIDDGIYLLNKRGRLVGLTLKDHAAKKDS